MAPPGSTAAPDRCPCNSSDGHAIGFAGGEPVIRCAACGLLYYPEDVRNRPATDSDWWAELAGERQNELHTALDAMRTTFDRQLAILERMVAGRSLVDVGAGAGLFLAAARDRGWNVRGVDANPHAGRAAAAFGLTYDDDAAEIPDGFADVLRLSHVLEHVPRPVDFLAPLTLKLKPGGVMVVIVPNGTPLCCTVVNRLRRLRDGQPKLAVPLSPGFHVLGFTTRALREIVAKTGVTPLTVTTVSMGNRTYYPMFYDGLMRRVPLREIPVRSLLRYWLPLIADNAGNRFGFGQWVIGYFRKPEASP